MLHQIGADRLDALEDPAAAEPRETQFELEAAADAVTDIASLVEEIRRHLATRLDRTHPRRRQSRTGEIAFERAARRLHFTRNIQTAGTPVAAEILPEVGQPPRRAQRVGRPSEIDATMTGNA